ncbi:uncharacterized protein [Clinocottus analis]|uniref:uncharacterized protein isoform X2 n=1 Tax=Clinocottus analis TaxID=304258 RepID=UPI0035C0CFF1
MYRAHIDGVSVPVHSCILSAISPQMSLALASAPPPPAGQSRLLEFRALGASSLLHMVRLLYCGEMAGEGEKEKREAISAAAKLGIHGLVEATIRDRAGRNEEDWRTEVGVQTEPLRPQEKEGSLGRWWREMTDGCTFLWKETLSDGKKDTWTQTEQPQVNADPPAQPAASFETIDMTTFQCLGQTDSHPAHPQISYIPISLVYPPDENQIRQPSSALTDFMQESTAAGHTVVAPSHNFVTPPLLPFSSHVTPGPADLQGRWAGPQEVTGYVTAVEEWGDEPLERFQDNIPGYISYFLNPDKEEAFGRGRGRRRGAAVGSARRAGTGERRARRPQARRGGRGRRGLTQTVDVQEVVVSKLQKLLLQRWGPTRAGQGGGAVGRKLYLKTRELLKSTKSVHGRKGQGKMWALSQSGDVLPRGKGGGNMQRRKNAALQCNQDGLPVGRAQWPKTKPTAPVSCSFPSPPHEQQPEQFDRLLEEVMMGLDILPNNSSAPHSQPLLPTGSSSYASCGDTLVQNKKCTTGLWEASLGFCGSAQVVAKARGDDVSSNSELSVLQRKGEINEMLDHFLQSFEQPGDSCTTREVAEVGGQSGTEASQPYTGLSKYRKNKTLRCSQITELPQSYEAEKLPRCSQPCETSATSATPPKNTEKAATKQRKKRRKNEYPFSVDKKRVRVRKPKTKDVHDDQKDKKLHQRPVVRLERRGQRSDEVTLQKCSCPEAKCPAKTKTYPLRSRVTDAHITDSLPFLEEPLQMKQPLAESRPNCIRDEPNNIVQVLSLSRDESSAPPIQPQPVEPCGMDEQRKENQQRPKKEYAVKPQEEAEGAPKMWGKRRAESEVTSDEAKRICFKQTAHSISETWVTSSQSADPVYEPATREIMDVSLTSIRDRLQIKDGEKETMWRELNLRQTEDSLMDEETEIIDVDGDPEDDCRPSRRAYTLSCLVIGTSSDSPSSCSEREDRLRSTGPWEEDKDEDIDVIGGFSPGPEPVIISWTESSEEEDIDVVGEKTDYPLSAVYATNRQYNTKVL